MAIDKRHKNTILSFVIIGLLSGLVHLILKTADDFAAGIIYFTTLAIGLVLGIILLILRLFKVIKNRSNFLYNYIGTLNVCLGVLLLIATILNDDKQDEPIKLFIIMALNFIIGFSILVDIYLKNRQVA